MQSVFVIVPAYNEASTIDSVVQGLLAAGYSTVVVDDGSTDETWSIVHRRPVYALLHPVNIGQGAALQTGTTFALQRGAGIIVHFDADGQHRVDDIESLIEPIRAGEADVVLGSRFLRKEHAQAVPRHRRRLLRYARIVNWMLTGVRLSDAHNGFRALSRKAASQIQLRENGFAHATEILMQIRRAGLRFVERPTAIVYTDYSQAKGQTARNGFRIIVDVVLRRIFR